MRSKTLLGVMALPLALAVGACSDSPAGPLSATQLPAIEGGGGQTSGSAALALLGSWKLVRIEKAGQAPQDVTAPDKFIADFSADGRLSARTDCNRCSGGYTATARALAVGPMACTLAACSSSPLDTDFAGLLSEASSWEATDSRLTLRSANGQLVMVR
jgi:heat shock protein HslJ